MPRPPKANKDKAPVLPPQPVMPAVIPRAVEVENFIRVRDSTLGRLKTIQQLIKSFADDYLRQTNLLLGLPTPNEDLNYNEPLANLEASIAALNSIPGPQQPIFAPAPPPEEQKKERKKRTLDPNAPKRPLTPYFLYMQTARPIIGNDLGSAAPKKAVQEEGQRRWATMNPQEKHGWNQAYAYNLRLYNARVHSYKAGNALAKGMDDSDALKYADEHEIPLPTTNEDVGVSDQAAIAEQLQGAVTGAVEETPATKKKAPSRKRKTDTAPEEAEAASRTPATPASPAQKRRRTSTKVAAEESQEPKKSGRKKGGKNA